MGRDCFLTVAFHPHNEGTIITHSKAKAPLYLLSQKEVLETVFITLFSGIPGSQRLGDLVLLPGQSPRVWHHWSGPWVRS